MSINELLVASGNKGKIAEIRHVLRDCVGQMYSLTEFPHIPVVVEDGHTFEANALKKALHAARGTGLPTLADDSGLVVPVLDGRPGVYSARYAGEGADDAANNAKLLADLTQIGGTRWQASFCCVMALCFPDGTSKTFTGELRGELLSAPQGHGGFGYDPLFFLPEFGRTLAELTLEEKNAISHRGKALAGVCRFLNSFGNGCERKSLHSD